VAAGPFEILVTGTAFDVRWTDDQQLRVRLREGAVVVRGSLAGAGLAVKAGQTFVARIEAGEVRLGSDESALAGTGSTMAATTPATVLAGATTTTPALAPTPPTARPLDAPGGDRRSVAAIVPRVSRVPRPRGVEDCLARCDDDGLDALARDARRRGELALAGRALVALRARRPATELGHEAAFVLGRLAEDQGDPSRALSFYDAYLDEEAGGHYRPYALGRKMALVERIEGATAARPLAERYLRLYPEGAHGAYARHLLDRP
jgi:hypothetical protein